MAAQMESLEYEQATIKKEGRKSSLIFIYIRYIDDGIINAFVEKERRKGKIEEGQQKMLRV